MSNQLALVADVHGNLEALERALEEISKRRIEHVICLGDIVGYGANPSECLQLVRERASEIVIGNHERAVDDLRLREDLVDWAREAIEWTSGVLNTSEKELLRRFPPLVIDHKSNWTLTHGTIHEPELFHYLRFPVDAAISFRQLETDFGFFGHTHVPSLFTEDGQARYLPAGLYKLEKGKRYLINPGSVGQPRDRNPKLCFGVFDPEELVLEIVRLDYDNRTAADKIRKAGLPELLAVRLM